MTDRESETSARGIRVHVQESLNSRDVFLVTPERLAPAITAKPGLAERVSISYGKDREALDRGLAEAEVLLVGNFESDDLAARAAHLKWVQSIFAGVEKLIDRLPQGVALTNASGVHAPKAGEYAMCAMLMLNSKVPVMQAFQRCAQWEPIFTPVIAGRTVAILGTGKIGAAVAAHARHFGMRVTGVNRSGRPVEPFDEVFATSDLHAALADAEFLVAALPNTKATDKLVDAAAFSRLSPGAGFVSIGRGQAVDEAALVDALDSGQVGGAALDVFEVEPLAQDSPLWTLENVLISAHCAVDDLDAYLPRAIEIFVDNLQRYVDGASLRNLVDPDLRY